MVTNNFNQLKIAYGEKKIICNFFLLLFVFIQTIGGTQMFGSSDIFFSCFSFFLNYLKVKILCLDAYTKVTKSDLNHSSVV